MLKPGSLVFTQPRGPVDMKLVLLQFGRELAPPAGPPEH
jgi:hypothetical protein